MGDCAKENPVDIMLVSILPFLVPLAFVLYHALRNVRCPECGDPLPPFCSPWRKTRRMWRAGGYLCNRCGCEANAAGQKVTADTPLTPLPTLQLALLAVLLLAGVGLGASALLIGPAVPAPPMVAAPPMVVLPAPALAPAPVN